MSSSRPGGIGVISFACSKRSSVMSPIALTTTTTSAPERRAATTRWATRLMCSAVATDDPPYFWTITPTECHPQMSPVRNVRIPTRRKRTRRKRTSQPTTHGSAESAVVEIQIEADGGGHSSELAGDEPAAMSPQLAFGDSVQPGDVHP